MKLKTSFFNGTVIKKDITRFAPLWALYFIGGILVMLSFASSSRTVYNAREVAATIGPFSVINMIYAGIAAQLLFGDLFNSRLCNALHAMPLQREQWFFNHVLVGIGFSVIPNALGIACFIPGMGKFWFVGLFWLLAMTMQYLFFFALAVFSMFCTGNRFAMVVVYGILNFAAMIALWFAQTIYQPLLYGVYIPVKPFQLLCPLVTLWGNLWDDSEYVILERIENWEAYGTAADEKVWEFRGLGDIWIYMIVLVAIAVILFAVSLVMYRRRKLESAGDFVAVAPLAPIFSGVYTLCVGAVFAMFGDLIGVPYVIFLVVGILIGYFTGQMLLRRTVKVFQPRTFLRCIGMGLIIIASVILVKLDPIGVTRWVPEPEKVQSVYLEGTIRDTLLVQNSESADPLNAVDYGNKVGKLTDPEDIALVIQAHQQILEQGEPKDYEDTLGITICYRMDNGKIVQRAYATYNSGKTFEALRTIMSRAEVVLGSNDIEELCQTVKSVSFVGMEVTNQEQIRGFMQAALADCREGTLAQGNQFHPNNKGIKEIVELYLGESENGSRYYISLRIYEDSDNSVAWLRNNGGLKG